MKSLYLFILLCLPFCIMAQSADLIIGHGEDNSFEKADQKAIMDLCSQLSVKVNVEFKDKVTESNGSTDQFSEQLIQTYSTVILENVSRNVNQAPDGKWIVERILSQEEKQKLFNHRKNKIFQYVIFAEQAEEINDAGSALKNYYWALLLLKSHPDKNRIRYNDSETKQVLLPYLNQKIQELLRNVQISVSDKKSIRENTTLYLSANLKGKSIANLKINYFDGIQPVESSIKDGKAVIYLPNSLAASEDFSCYIDYEYSEYLKDIPQDDEVKLVKENLSRIPFENKKNFSLKSAPAPDTVKSQEKPIQQTVEPPIDLIKAVTAYISSNQKTNIEPFFTPEALAQFKKVLNYGKTKLYTGKQEINAIKVGNQTMIRSIPLEIELKDKNKKILKEDICLILENDKVVWINFTINDKFIEQCLVKGAKLGDQTERLKSIQFLEYYKTMFALKETNKISDIFADSALIFIGYVKAKSPVDKRLRDVLTKEFNKEELAFQKLSKDQYIDRISKIFANNAAINLNFSDVQVIKRSADKAIYAVQLKQDYYSSNYSDKGYLLLFYDMTDLNKPQIFFRYWQPSKMTGDEVEQLNRMTGRFRF